MGVQPTETPCLAAPEFSPPLGRPSMYWKQMYAGWFGIHFFLLTAVCVAGIFWLIAEGATIVPPVADNWARKAELVATWCLGKEARASNPIRTSIAAYLHAVGVQAGYSFFAPNVPSHHRLTFELIYEDGRIEYDSPHLRSKAAALRLDSLLDRLPDQRYESIRESLVKMLAFSVWRDHPDVKKIRATFGAVNPPSINEFAQGRTETFQPMFSFEFSLRGEQEQ